MALIGKVDLLLEVKEKEISLAFSCIELKVTQKSINKQARVPIKTKIF